MTETRAESYPAHLHCAAATHAIRVGASEVLPVDPEHGRGAHLIYTVERGGSPCGTVSVWTDGQEARHSGDSRDDWDDTSGLTDAEALSALALAVAAAERSIG